MNSVLGRSPRTFCCSHEIFISKLLIFCRSACACCLWLAAALTAIPARSQEAPKDLGDKSIKDVLNIEVTSISKKEDMCRSVATTIPDLLPMIPGLAVACVNSGNCAISSRGFHDQTANQLLVLMDGRTVYSPLFSDVALLRENRA